MMRTFLRQFAWMVLFGLVIATTGCVDAKPNVPIGTTEAALRAKFGPPLYRSPAEKGRQLWFYDVTFEHLTKYRDTTPFTVDANGETQGGAYGPVTEHTYESHPAALVISPTGIVIDVPDGHVNPTQ